MSIRTKLTLALLVTSFAAIAVVGATARTFMLRRFDDFVVDRAVEGFLLEAIGYYRTYGSWEAARTAESFFDYAARTRGEPGGLRPRGDNAGPAPVERSPRGPRPRGLGFGEPPPFAVTDEAGRALLPLAGLEVGEAVTPSQLEGGRPILDGSDRIGVAVPMSPPPMTDLEERYLSAMQDAWLYSLLLASVLVVPVGLMVGDRLARPIRDITQAMEAMKEGRLRHEVPVRSGDEIGQLTTSFNEMSGQLASAYEELQASRAELDAHAREMTELSRRDPLTDLLNRRGFDEQTDVLLAQARRYEHSTCVAMLDLDHFKRINDDLSHQVGDQVLLRAAAVLKRELRQSDVLARYGGEEFVVAFTETDENAAAVLAERLRGAVEASEWGDLVPFGPVTISIGLTQVHEGETLPDALARADDRLYRAKAGGRNRVEV